MRSLYSRKGRKAVFLDRDGVLNELVYFAEQGRIDTPLTPAQFRLVPGVVDGIKTLQASGYQVIIVSNQPGIAKGQFTPKMFDRIRQKTRRLLQREGIRLDGEYYCLHHPHATRKEYRVACNCRKPRPGLILKAAQEAALDVKSSFMVGDGFTDIEAGRKAGCKTILIGHLSSLLTQMMEKKRLYPTYLAENFEEAVRWILLVKPTKSGAHKRINFFSEKKGSHES
jgi:D-glycero-D-manno-heptose 1,7-bisphosphate phosphatase